MRRALLLPWLLCGCAVTPSAPVAAAGGGDDLLRPGASWTFADPRGSATRCEVAATASEWRRLRQELGVAAADVPEPPSAFAGERVVVAWLRGPGVEPAVELRIGTEEGVDVVTLVPTARRGASEATVVFVLVVPERQGQLAVVAALPDGDDVHERTLAVFPRH